VAKITTVGPEGKNRHKNNLVLRFKNGMLVLRGRIFLKGIYETIQAKEQKVN
jgi:hypothetical protein